MEDLSDGMESIETRDVVETGELERSLSPQEMICGGAMIGGEEQAVQAMPLPLTAITRIT